MDGIGAFSRTLLALLACCVLTLLVSGCGNSSDDGQDLRTARFEVSVSEGVLFGVGRVEGDPAEIELRLDLYEPTGVGVPDSLPAMIFVHGEASRAAVGARAASRRCAPSWLRADISAHRSTAASGSRPRSFPTSSHPSSSTRRSSTPSRRSSRYLNRCSSVAPGTDSP